MQAREVRSADLLWVSGFEDLIKLHIMGCCQEYLTDIASDQMSTASMEEKSGMRSRDKGRKARAHDSTSTQTPAR